MQFVADENVDPRIIARLRLDGHYIYSIYESNRGLKNGEVLALANQRQAVLITEDKDFGEMLQREGSAAVGVVLVRLPDKTVPLEQKVEMVARTIDQCGLRLQAARAIALNPLRGNLPHPRRRLRNQARSRLLMRALYGKHFLQCAISVK